MNATDPRPVALHRGPERTVYGLTQTGREHLATWPAEPIEPALVENLRAI